MVKKPRMAPGGPPRHMMGISANPMHAEEDKNRLLTFKEFISKGEDLDETNSITKYQEYKTDFTKTQIDKFFKEHQYEEWFRNRYRPKEIEKFKEARTASKANRKELFNSYMSDISLEQECHDKVSKFLEEFSILLEGANLTDLSNDDARKQYAVSTIYITNLHPSIEKSMIEEYASTQEGFLRVAISDEQAERGFKRRAWVTFKQMDIDALKKLCWGFNTQKFNGQEIRAVINKELVNRTKLAQFWFRHEKCAKSDLKNVARVLTHFEGDDCPLLESIKDFLIEESNEVSKTLNLCPKEEEKFEFKQNGELMKALDKCILYLRCVHSFDYYAYTEYIGEDDMPQRTGIMFIRPLLPQEFDDNPQKTLEEFIEFQKSRIDGYLDKPTLTEGEQKLLGAKNADEEIENFIYQHTVEKVPGEKYVCKLTKKRFTAPEFVRKHIFNRCTDKLDEVRADVEFFNNYVADPKRPM